MIVTATELKIQGFLGLFRFWYRIGAIRRQLTCAEGVRFTRLRGFRTLTGWESAEAMRTFRNTGAHLEAMKNLAGIGKAKSVTWETNQEPSWAEAVARLRAKAF